MTSRDSGNCEDRAVWAGVTGRTSKYTAALPKVNRPQLAGAAGFWGKSIVVSF
jgi:hypothetical protein